MPCRVSSVLLAATLASASLLSSGCDLVSEDERYVVSAYGGPSFDQEDATLSFTADIDSESVILRSSVPDGGGPPYGTNSIVLTLKETGQNLPALDDVWYGPPGGGVGTVILRSRIELQDWNPSRLISGVLHAELPNGAKTSGRFWIPIQESD